MGKFLALDIGEKRVGVARSDDVGQFAFALTTLNVGGEISSDLQQMIKEESPQKIVVGLPRNMDGTLGFQAEKVREFVRDNLEKYETIVEYEDESVTSIEAQRLMRIEGKDPEKDKGMIDAYAAKVILESYLNR